MTRRNKVALTILMGLALIGIFAVTQSGVAIFAIARFGTSFNQIAQTNLPALIAASQLSELSSDPGRHGAGDCACRHAGAAASHRRSTEWPGDEALPQRCGP